MIINQQSQDLLTGVRDNLDGQFNGNGTVPMIGPNGFAMSSTGLARWHDQRTKEMSSKYEGKAFDLFRQRLETSHGQATEGTGTAGSRIAYAASAGSNGLAPYVFGDAASASYGADAELEDIKISHMALWNMWVKGSWTRYEGDGSSFEGETLNVVGGIDYRLREDLIVGILGGYGVARFDTVIGGTAGDFDADGYSIGAYMGHQITPSLMFDALVAYTASDYNNTVGAATGSFEAARVTVAAHLRGRMDIDNYTVEPTLGFLWASEDQDSYTDSAAVFHASQTVTAGRLSLGPKIHFPEVAVGSAMTQFWLAAFGEYDFSNQANSVTSGLPDIDDVTSARLQAGFTATSDTGILFSLQGDLSGLGSGEYTAYGATARITILLN